MYVFRFLLLLTITGLAHAQELLWPIPEALHDRTYISNYLDQKAGTGNGTQDYKCGFSHLYDGHLGLDIAVNDFRVADQGVPIVAVSGGTVTSVTYNQFDRNLWPPYTGSGNGVWIQHDDGRYSIYWHMRQNSVAVAVGERVSGGQFLGYVASSGSSPIPHLHFQYNQSAQLNDRLPLFAGNCSPGVQDVFERPHEYVGNSPLRVLALGTHRQSGLAEGVYQGGAIAEIKQGLHQPAVHGTNENSLGVFVEFQGNTGQQLSVALLEPDGSVHVQKGITLQSKRRYGWYLAQLPLAATKPAGTWKIRVSDATGERAVKKILFDEHTIMPPRFFPLAGQSVRLNGAAQQILLTQSLANPGTLELDGQLEGVRLEGGSLVIDASTRLDRRTTRLAVISRDPATGLQDVFHVHLVDPQAAAQAMSFGPGHTGFYISPGHPGQGIALEVNAALKVIFLAWFTFDAPLGHGDAPQWATAFGNFEGAFATLETEVTTGGEFARPTPVSATPLGELGKIRLELESCERLNLVYEWGPGNEGFIAMQPAFPGACE